MYVMALLDLLEGKVPIPDDNMLELVVTYFKRLFSMLLF